MNSKCAWRIHFINELCLLCVVYVRVCKQVCVSVMCACIEYMRVHVLSNTNGILVEKYKHKPHSPEFSKVISAELCVFFLSRLCLLSMTAEKRVATTLIANSFV